MVAGATTIKVCSCDNAFQDQKYGRKMRVHNVMAKDNETRVRCTVCATEKAK